MYVTLGIEFTCPAEMKEKEAQDIAVQGFDIMPQFRRTVPHRVTVCCVAKFRNNNNNKAICKNIDELQKWYDIHGGEAASPLWGGQLYRKNRGYSWMACDSTTLEFVHHPMFVSNAIYLVRRLLRLHRNHASFLRDHPNSPIANQHTAYRIVVEEEQADGSVEKFILAEVEI